MRCREASAWRSPPRFKRCRLVFPEEAGIGLTPHSAAKAASEWRRSGLLPAATRRVSAVSGPYAEHADQRRRCRQGEAFQLGLEVVDLLTQLAVAAGQ